MDELVRRVRLKSVQWDEAEQCLVATYQPERGPIIQIVVEEEEKAGRVGEIMFLNILPSPYNAR